MSNVLSEEKKQQVIALEGSLDGLYGASSKPLVCVEKQPARTCDSGGRRCTAAAFLGKANPGKTGQRGDPDFITPFSAKPAIRSTCEAYR
jgi:hypothetical protein